jgi:hypothetical protein
MPEVLAEIAFELNEIVPKHPEHFAKADTSVKVRSAAVGGTTPLRRSAQDILGRDAITFERYVRDHAMLFK